MACVDFTLNIKRINVLSTQHHLTQKACISGFLEKWRKKKSQAWGGEGRQKAVAREIMIAVVGINNPFRSLKHVGTIHLKSF